MRLKQLLVTGVAAAALLTGCAGSGGSDASAPDMAVYSRDADGGGASGAEMASEDAARAMDGDLASTDVVSDSEYLVREASLGIKVDSISDAALQVREIAVGAGGSVTNEQFGDGFYGPVGTDITQYGTMTVSVPSDRLDAALTQLSELGEVRTRTLNTSDVQDEYVDVEARIATLEASIDRMRSLMEQTEDIEQIVELETALSARQADLDSLQARLNSLTSRIAMSPITVMLTTTDDLGEPDDGIIGALKDAWNAFTTSAAVLVTTIGALLPWLLVGGLALWALLVALRAVRRRRQRTGTRPTPRASDPAGTDPAADTDSADTHSADTHSADTDSADTDPASDTEPDPQPGRTNP